jgi:hypothetical protein
MTHAPKFWAAKLPTNKLTTFWNLVTEWGFDGETAYCRVMDGTYTHPVARA